MSVSEPTITALQPPQHLFPSHYQHSPYSQQSVARTQSLASHSQVHHSPYTTNSPASTTTLDHHPTSSSVAPHRHVPLASSNPSPTMQTSRKRDKRTADWNKFYENGLPKEIIVIDDDSPAPTSVPPRRKSPRISQPHPTAQAAGSVALHPSLPHADKRRRVDAAAHQAVYRPADSKTTRHSPIYDDSGSNGSSSAGRTTGGYYSTAPTSLESYSSSGQRQQQKVSGQQVGQKRKRTGQRQDGVDEDEIELVVQNSAWANYIPPPRPPVKAQDVYVQVVRAPKTAPGTKHDDDDGHYIVTPDTDLTDRYKIIKLLGQGTFGKVVEAFDKRKGTSCAVKIIRAVPKYRDASRIELRVLSTLASNDKSNRNRCIHLRDCFDFRNHICIVTDLLGESVFDFLKRNSFVPFPSTHIQQFARQLFTSVAFLHDLNLIHTDLKPENILLVNGAYQTFTYNRTIPSSSKNVNRTSKVRRVLLNPEIRLIDFGSATFNDEYHSSVVSTRHYRAPEIILNLGWSFPCDIWSIGCILVEFFTGDALFQTHDNLEHLAMMEAVCNARLEKETIQLVRSGRGNSRNAAAAYFLPRGFRLNYPNDETSRTSKKYVKNMKRLEETIPPTTEFNRKFLDLLKEIFVYDPAKRITAKQALQHPWFKEALLDDGTEALKIRLNKELKGTFP